MSVGIRILGAIVGLGALLAMAWASRAPLPVDRSGEAIVRVSFGARPERIETCRRQSNEELAKVAPQMRLQVVCEGVTARYQLEVRRNDKVLLSQVVRGGGLRNDRQLYVSRDLRVPAGSAGYSMTLARIDTVQSTEDDDEGEGGRADTDEDDDDDREGGAERLATDADSGVLPGRAAREADERRRRRGEAIPADLRLNVDAALAPGEVLLFTYDQEKRSLASRRAGDRNR